MKNFSYYAGLIFNEGTNLSQHRRFSMKHLKTFGWGQATMESNMILEAESLVQFLVKQSKDGPVPMHKAFDIAVLNAIWTLFAGHRFEYNDQKAHDILREVHLAFTYV